VSIHGSKGALTSKTELYDTEKNESRMILVQVANLNSPNLTSSQSIFRLLHAPIQDISIGFPVTTTLQYQHVPSQQRSNLPVEYIDVRKRKGMKIVNTKYSHVATADMRTQSIPLSLRGLPSIFQILMDNWQRIVAAHSSQAP